MACAQPLTADPPPDNLQPRYNVAPTQDVMVVRLGKDGRREAVRLRWGLIPGWAKDAGGAAKCINARAETVDTLPSFRSAFAKRRCLVLASGFYEWKKIGKVEKQPYYISLKDASPMAFAGLWESWMSSRGPAVETCSIVTTKPNELLGPLHSRMPVILDEVDHARWLGQEPATVDELKAMLKPYPDDPMQLWPVDRQVGSVKVDEPDLIKPEMVDT